MKTEKGHNPANIKDQKVTPKLKKKKLVESNFAFSN